MIEAYKKRAENIVEYVLYMYHTEDVIRSCQLNLDLIKSAIIAPSELSDDEKNALFEWYKGVVHEMEKENIEERGHLNELIDIIGELSYIHKSLLNNDKYKALYQKASPYLVEISKKSSGATLNPIELGLNGIYGIMTLKMKKQEIYPETVEAVKTFTGFLMHLAQVYHLVQRGEYQLN